jgi:hypothetical protein
MEFDTGMLQWQLTTASNNFVFEYPTALVDHLRYVHIIQSCINGVWKIMIKSFTDSTLRCRYFGEIDTDLSVLSQKTQVVKNAVQQTVSFKITKPCFLIEHAILSRHTCVNIMKFISS